MADCFVRALFQEGVTRTGMKEAPRWVGRVGRSEKGS